MTRQPRSGKFPGFAFLTGLALTLLMGCSKPVTPEPPLADPPTTGLAQADAPALLPVAGMQDLMRNQLEPSAGVLWASVGSTVTAAGEEEFAPSTPEEWERLHAHALIVVETANLLLVNGRRVVRHGVEQLEDHGTPGNLTAEEAETAIAANREVFEDFVVAMRSTGQDFLSAIEAKDKQGMLDAGHSLELLCEGCHLKFWYPGQVIPPFPTKLHEAPKPPQA